MTKGNLVRLEQDVLAIGPRVVDRAVEESTSEERHVGQ